MNLQIRDPRARKLAQQLAKQRNLTMTEAVIEALEGELQRQASRTPLRDRVASIASELKRHAAGGGREVTKHEIDTLWGHD